MKDLSTSDIIFTVIILSVVAGALMGFARSAIEGVAYSWHRGRLRAEREHRAETMRSPALDGEVSIQP